MEEDTTKKRPIDRATSKLKFENNGNGEEYEVATIYNSAVDLRKSESHRLQGLYYFVF